MALQNIIPFVERLRPLGDDKTPRLVGVLTCTRCSAERVERVQGHHFSPLHYVNRAKINGWECSLGDKVVICPDCVVAMREAKRNKQKETTPMPTKPTSAPAGALPRMPNGTPYVAAGASVPGGSGGGSPESRTPTPQQRLAIRGALDEHFDDAKGRYLGGFSDDRIAEHLGLPRAFVTSIREAAYGPLLGNPEVDAIRAEVADLEQRLAALAKQHDSVAVAMQSIRANITALAARMDVFDSGGVPK